MKKLKIRLNLHLKIFGFKGLKTLYEKVLIKSLFKIFKLAVAKSNRILENYNGKR